MSFDTYNLPRPGTRTERTRREFLRETAVGFGSIGLSALGAGRAAGARNGRPKSVIFIIMVGGPSQLETWDPKPDAPAEIRGPFRSIATRIPGIRISEHLPRLASRMDQLALVRSIYHESAPIHEAGLQLLQTGRLCRNGGEHPHFGAIVSHLDGALADHPGFAMVPGPISYTGIDLPHGQTASWLANATPTIVRGLPTVRGKSDHPITLGESLAIARELVEFGVRCVTVNMFDTVFNRPSWDCHGMSPFSTLDDYANRLLPEFDHAVTALIEGLERTGRLDDTLIVATGEFGRSPRINAVGGRDHWPGAWSAMLAGGGIRGGTVIGSTDRDAGAPRDHAVTPMDLLATIYRILGIDHAQQIIRPDGESYQLVEDGQPISGLIG